MSFTKNKLTVVLPFVLLSSVVFSGALSTLQPSFGYETNVQTRDPSTVVKSDGEYFVYGTGFGIPQFSSKDRIHWTFRGPVFPTPPTWLATAVPKNRGNFYWAPDIHFFNGKWHLYYSVSSWGSKTSAIGTAINNTLNPKTWVDEGVVVQSGSHTDFNTIDPCIFQDENDQPWLSFGSYFGGIRLIKIDVGTAKQSTADTTLYSIATRPHTPPNAIEASAIIYHNGYYYLFVNFDMCCAGPRSSYNIRVGRSKSVTGPYVDKDGVDMMDGGGSLFLGSLYDNGSGRLIDDEVGPGHFGYLHDSEGDWVSFHEEWARDKNGATTVNLQRLAFDNSGWPLAVLDPGPYKIISNLATHDAMSSIAPGVNDGKLLHTWPDLGTIDQSWTLQYNGDGLYRILGAVSLKALTTVTEPGRDTPLTLTSPSKTDTQLWYVRLNVNGTYSLLPKAGAMKLALDVADGQAADGGVVRLWDDNLQAPQQWSFRHR